ncbi:ABC transporter permease [Bauldia sp.]|uniref:ABC transporter permease n=1 Tax=Bauldia sp. TaxID=2575872 RepID=UPI003BAD6191
MFGAITGGYFLRRLVASIVTLVVVMSLVFLADRQIGDPARMVLGTAATEEDVLQLRERMGLEDPLWVQYQRFLVGMATGDMGDTFRYGISKPLTHGAELPDSRKTLPIAMERLPATLFLGGTTILFSILVALPLGIYAAVRPRSIGDRVVNVLSLAGVSIVEYWFALILILVFAVNLGWLPTSGYGTAANVILPALALSLRPIGRITQIARSSMLDELAKPYVTAARGRGIPVSRISWIHALRNAAIPIVTTIGDETVNVVTGVIIIEVIFGWPGIGALTVDALAIRDVPLVEATIFLLVLIVLTVNLVVDLIYAALNPRVRLG